MSDRKPGDTREPAVLVRAFPQLENHPAGTAAASAAKPAGGTAPQPAREASSNVAQFPAPVNPQKRDLSMLGDVPLAVVFEVGCQVITVQQLMELCRGSVVPLHDVFVDSIDVKVSDQLIARGEAINLKHRYGIRISELVIPVGMEPK